MTVAASYAVCNIALAVIACSIPLCRTAFGSDRAHLRRWPTASGVDMAGPQALIAMAAVDLAILTEVLSKTLPAVELDGHAGLQEGA